MANYPVPVPGTIWLSPDQANVGGTRLTGILEHKIEWQEGRVSELFKSDLDDDAFVALTVQDEPPVLSIPLIGHNANTMKLLFAHGTTAGSAVRGSGGEANDRFLKAVSFALALRPVDTSELFLYGGAWQLHPESRARMTWSRKQWLYEGHTLLLFPSRPNGASVPAYAWDTAANIDTLFGLEAEPEA